MIRKIIRKSKEKRFLKKINGRTGIIKIKADSEHNDPDSIIGKYLGDNRIKIGDGKKEIENAML